MTIFKVLLVEDHQSWQDILRDKIRRALHAMGHPDDVIEIAKTFDEAYQSLKENPWHLLVTDIGLGDLSTSQQKLGTQLVELANDLHVPAIAVSGTPPVTTQHVRDLLLDYGAADFFRKQEFDSRKFITKVQELLQKSDQAVAAPVSELKESVGQTYALLIGIADYRHISPLAKTTNDARDFYEVLLENGYVRSQMTLLLDQSATKAAMNAELDQLARTAQPEDTVVIFFAGHGAQLIGGFSPGEYLCPVETTIHQVKETCISQVEFTTALRSIRAGRVVIFLDACHAGGVGEPKDLETHVKMGLSETAYNHLQGKGRIIIASCKPDEVSWELPEMRNGLFTHHLLAGLRGRAARPDGTIWMSQLFGYVYEQVSQSNRQHPYQKSDAEDFMIARAQPALPTASQHSLESKSEFATSSTSLSYEPIEVRKSNLRVKPVQLRKVIHRLYDRPAFEILCLDLGLDYHDLRGETMEAKIAYLIQKFERNHCYEKLVEQILSTHPDVLAQLQS